MRYRIRTFRADGWDGGDKNPLEYCVDLEEALEQAQFFVSTGEWDKVQVEHWEDGLFGWGWYRVQVIEREEDNEKGITTMAKTTSGAAAEVPATPKLTRNAGGQLIEVATDKRSISGLTPAVRMELQGAGMLEQYTPPIREDQTLEWQISRNKKALAALAHWAKTACPKDPFKGGPLGGKEGWENQRHRRHPAAEAWNQISKPTEYKSCPQTQISEKGWQWLAGMGIVKPSEKDQDKPCASR